MSKTAIFIMILIAAFAAIAGVAYYVVQKQDKDAKDLINQLNQSKDQLKNNYVGKDGLTNQTRDTLNVLYNLPF